MAVPLNLYPRQVPLGEVGKDGKVYISDQWHRFIFEMIRRMGGTANDVLTDIASLTPTDSNIIVGDGSTWVAESGNTARTSLGLGTGDSPQFTALNIGDASDTTLTRASAGVVAAEGSNLIKANGTVPLTADWDVGSFEVRAQTFESDVVTGTAPFTIASTTVSTNLNADMVDGKHEAAFVLVDGTRALTADWDAGSFEIRAQTFESDVVTGTAPLVIASTTKVDNLHVARATLGDTVTVADAGGDTTTWVLLGTSQTGNLSPATDAGLTYNATSNELTATGFIGALTGNASTATALQTARTIGGTSFDGTANIVPATITVADTTDTTCSVALFESATGDLAPKTDGGLTYNASTGALTATSFSGSMDSSNFTGTNWTDLTDGGDTTLHQHSAVTVADEASDTTCFLLFTTAATGNLQPKTNSNLAINASNGAITFASVGPHGVGTSPDARYQLALGGTFSHASGASTAQYRVAGTLNPLANADAYTQLIAGTTINEASSGTHVLFASLGINAPTIGAGSAATTNATTVYVDNAPSGATNNYAMWGNNGSMRWDGIASIGTTPSTTTNLNLAAGTTGVSSLRIPHGSAPTSPVDGDMWTTTSGLFVRINGSTVGPLT